MSQQYESTINLQITPASIRMANKLNRLSKNSRQNKQHESIIIYEQSLLVSQATNRRNLTIVGE